MSGSRIAASYRRLERHRAARHRRSVAGVTFVAVTGSAGKTTTKELVAAVLGSRHLGTKSPGTHNSAHWVSHTVLGARRGDGFCVQELGATGPGSLDDAIALVRPRVAVITNVGGDHRSAFRTLEATATEKAKVVHAVPRAGLAVLNADDPRVLAMADSCRGRVLTYGLRPDAIVRAESVRSSWPDTSSPSAGTCSTRSRARRAARSTAMPWRGVVRDHSSRARCCSAVPRAGTDGPGLAAGRAAELPGRAGDRPVGGCAHAGAPGQGGCERDRGVRWHGRWRGHSARRPLRRGAVAYNPPTRRWVAARGKAKQRLMIDNFEYFLARGARPNVHTEGGRLGGATRQ